MLGCRCSLGTERRESVSVGEFGHPKGESAHRHNLYVAGDHDKPAGQFSPGTSRPGARQRPARGGHHTATQSHEVEVRCRGLVIREDLSEPGAHVVGEQVAQQVIVEDGPAHVVASSESPSSDRTNAACSSRLTRSLKRRRPWPRGSVTTAKPRSTTSTGPPSSRSHRCRTAAGNDICPDDDTKYSRTSLTSVPYLVTLILSPSTLLETNLQIYMKCCYAVKT